MTASLTDRQLTVAASQRADAAEWAERFEEVYRASGGSTDRIPWAHERPCPSMVTWLNAIAPRIIRPGARAAVVGCGLGNDAVCLAQRGYDVTAFDCCPSAIEHAKRRFPEFAGLFRVADLFDLPGCMHGRYDLVVEVHTLQALPPTMRIPMASAMRTLLTHNGVLLAIARGRPDEVPLEGVDGPPFSFTAEEFRATLTAAGFELPSGIDDFTDDNRPPVRRLRAAAVRGGGD